MNWNKPLPQPTTISAPFWDGLKAHELQLQRCEDCGESFFFPRLHCPHCGSRRVSWQRASGAATLYTYTVARIPTLPEFTDEMPQILAVAQLAEGPHLNTTVVGVPESELKVGMALRPVFDDRPGLVSLLRFTAIDSAQPGVIAAEPQAEAAPAPEAPAAPARRQVSCKDFAAMQSLVSESFGDWSNEIVVSQELINDFAKLSGDDYWIHTDAERARAQSPFGTTIAQGSLVQVLVSKLKLPLDYEVVDFNNMVNYGSDRLRFPSPVPAGCRIRGRARVKKVEQVRSGVQVTMELNIHIVGQDRPSVINDLVVLYM